jgi:hypothetical protein
MRRVLVVAAILALLLAAASDARRGGTLRIDMRSDYDFLESTIVCDPRPFHGDLAKAAAILLGGGPPPGSTAVLTHGRVRAGDKWVYCAGELLLEDKGAGRTAAVTTARTAPKVAAGVRGFRIQFDDCPYVQTTGCSLARPYVFRIRFAGESKSACRTLTVGPSPLASFVRAGGGTWRTLKTRGALSHSRPAELVPALVDRVCGRNTPRAQRFGRELGLGGPTAPPQPVNGSLVVDSKANIFGAGLSQPPAPGGGGAGVLPPVFRFNPRPGLEVTFNVTGSITCCITAGGPYNGPAGRTDVDTNLAPAGVVSGVRAGSAMFLAGVFLSGRLPESPPPVDTATSFPRLGQVFFIGSGRTVNVPTEATRLYLGIADGYGFAGQPGHYSDNSGTFAATFTIRP